MKLNIITTALWLGVVKSSVLDRQLLSYAPIPVDAYSPPANSSITTLLDFVTSRSDLTNLTAILEQAAGKNFTDNLAYEKKSSWTLTIITGFTQAFSTPTNWKFTFFAPTDTAFKNTGYYFDTFAATPKGKWWLGNLLQHHYVPNTAMTSKSFNATALRFQTGSFLYVGAQVVDGQIKLNNYASIVEADIPVTNVCHWLWNLSYYYSDMCRRV